MPIARLLGCLTLAVVHDLAPEHELGQLRRRASVSALGSGARERPWRYQKAARANALLQRFALPRSDLVLVTSFSHKQTLLARLPRLEADNVMVVPAGLNPDLVKPLEITSPGKVPTIGTVGSLFDGDVALLRDALRLLPSDLTVRVQVGGADAAEVLRFGLGPNIEVLVSPGLRYLEFSRFASAVDLWLLIWGRDPYLETISPLRVPICLASLRPVITTPLEELNAQGLAQFGEVVLPTAELIAAGIVRVLRSRDEVKLIEANEAIVTRHTWADRFVEVVGRLRSAAG